MHFNSTIVRLKETTAPLMQLLYHHFNSTIVRLKVSGCIWTAWGQLQFQFYDSTIKSFKNRMKALASGKNFNSTIVRLKAIDQPAALKITLFQFYDSTIKS